MKIICNKKEYAALVRGCQESEYGRYGASCSGCVFARVCSQGNIERDDGDVMTHIEDICEIDTRCSYAEIIENHMKIGGNYGVDMILCAEGDANG